MGDHKRDLDVKLKARALVGAELSSIAGHFSGRAAHEVSVGPEVHHTGHERQQEENDDRQTVDSRRCLDPKTRTQDRRLLAALPRGNYTPIAARRW